MDSRETIFLVGGYVPNIVQDIFILKKYPLFIKS